MKIEINKCTGMCECCRIIMLLNNNVVCVVLKGLCSVLEKSSNPSTKANLLIAYEKLMVLFQR